LAGSQNEEDKALAAVMQDQAKANGIDIVITLLDSAAISARISARNYQLAMQGQNYVPTDDPSVHYRNGYYHSKSFYNTYSTPALDAKVDRLFASLDAAERVALHREIQRDVTAQVPVIMMFHRNNVILANKKLAGFRVARGTWQIFKGLEQAWIN
jgi:ABC-type transport system substrate-binding protein